MKLMIASYNNGGSVWNAEAEETSFLHYIPTHGYNEAAECTIIIADSTGTKAAKYNDITDANAVYRGAGKVTIEDPNGTDIFYGRILTVTANTDKREVELYCQDWLSQLDEEQIKYDMREPLNAAGLRQSDVSSDVDGTCEPVSQVFMYAKADDGGAFTDESTEIGDDTADDMNLLPAAPAVDDTYYFGFDVDTIEQFQLDISTAGSWVGTLTWEFYGLVAGEGPAWNTITVTDGTSSFTEIGENSLTWAIDGGDDWQTVAIDGTTKYWLRAVVSAFTSLATQPLGKQAWPLQTLYDDDIDNFDADEWNGMYLVFPNDMAGEKKITVGPYADTVAGSGGQNEAGSYADIWADDANSHDIDDNNASFIVTYDFHINAELGSIYSAGPDMGKIYLTYMVKTAEAATTRAAYVKVRSAAEADTTIGVINFTDDTTNIRKTSFDIPLPNLSGFVDVAGEATIKIEVQVGVGNVSTLEVYQCLLELDYTLTGTSSKYLITDTTTNTIVSEANLTYKGLGIYETCPYSVIQPIYKHIDSAEGGTLITDGDIMVELTCAATIEHTSGFSARQYIDQTRLAILKDLGAQDDAVLWMALGTTIVNRKSTFDDAVADATLTDTDVNVWVAKHDYQTLVNKATVYGMRIGDTELSSTYSDATSIAKYIATRTKVERNAGLVSEYDTLTRATAIVNQYKDVQMILTATLDGNTAKDSHPKTIVLGDEIQITSTYLDLTNAWYVVQRYSYDSRNDLTTLLLHPRVSVGLQKEEFTSIDNVMQDNRRGGTADKYVSKPTTNTVV